MRERTNQGKTLVPVACFASKSIAKHEQNTQNTCGTCFVFSFGVNDLGAKNKQNTQNTCA